mmetsp:Transcript_7541/g.9107  ORF Transcript_7541/g.9107 Transcript_7541/m.9107 type:complete len:108 (-) Transcript_7541:1239-1562(-)|eukprot:CAMPEP_0170467964 /NCGR_PEP_ID=MMETSP0123-20130129/11336_1 /TAXON_ID=182087 /ORGANISM="Favella ehrenbergii, Strain Fehren 1" /LENGTH=107 /DNA_ID=CAMNT_0010734443 /DNA_START=1596 /DNA_END=1919 /DNA_ORIENTATION=+
MQTEDIKQFWNEKRIEADIANLANEVEYLRSESELIDWYVIYMEEGRSSKDVMKMHAKLEQKHKKLLERHRMMIADFEGQISELNAKLDGMRQQLKKQQETVTKPLI